MKVVLNAVFQREVFEFILEFTFIPKKGDKICLDSDTYDEHEKDTIGCEDTFVVEEVHYVMEKNLLNHIYIVAHYDRP